MMRKRAHCMRIKRHWTQIEHVCTSRSVIQQTNVRVSLRRKVKIKNHIKSNKAPIMTIRRFVLIGPFALSLPLSFVRRSIIISYKYQLFSLRTPNQMRNSRLVIVAHMDSKLSYVFHIVRIVRIAILINDRHTPVCLALIYILNVEDRVKKKWRVSISTTRVNNNNHGLVSSRLEKHLYYQKQWRAHEIRPFRRHHHAVRATAIGF